MATALASATHHRWWSRTRKKKNNNAAVASTKRKKMKNGLPGAAAGFAVSLAAVLALTSVNAVVSVMLLGACWLWAAPRKLVQRI